MDIVTQSRDILHGQEYKPGIDISWQWKGGDSIPERQVNKGTQVVAPLMRCDLRAKGVGICFAQ
jgi:hypothetical protein